MSILIFAIATVFNLIILRFKWNRQHKIDAVLDVCILAFLITVFGGSFEGTIIAMVSSFIMSLYLWFYPPKLLFKNPFKNKSSM
jgi:multisubunit Na+/H+ antiporter MnhB subunit